MYLSFTCNRHVSTQQVWCCSRMFRRRHLPRFASSSLYRLPHLSQSNSLSPPQKSPSPPCTLPQPTADHSHAPPCILQSDPGETPLFPAAWAAAPCSHQTVHQPTSGLGHSQGRFRLCSGETPGVPHAAHARRDVMSGAPSVQTSSDRSNSILTINKIMQWQHQAVRVEHAPAGWSVNWATCSEDSAPLKLTIRTPTPGGGGGGRGFVPGPTCHDPRIDHKTWGPGTQCSAKRQPTLQLLVQKRNSSSVATGNSCQEAGRSVGASETTRLPSVQPLHGPGVIWADPECATDPVTPYPIC